MTRFLHAQLIRAAAAGAPKLPENWLNPPVSKPNRSKRLTKPKKPRTPRKQRAKKLANA